MGCKQQKRILSPFWRSESEISISGLKSRNQSVVMAACPPKAVGEICSLPVPPSGGGHGSLACGHIPPTCASLATCLLLFRMCQTSLCLPSVRAHGISFRAHLDNPGWCLFSIPLFSSHLQGLCRIREHPQLSGTRMRTSWGPLSSLL